MTTRADMDDRDGLAAEYVLGTLPLAERAEAQRLIGSDAEFARLVSAWEHHLDPLNDEFGEMTPPADMLARIENRLFPTAPKPARWRLPFFGALAGLAALALVAFWPATAPNLITARLTGDAQPLVVAASFNPDAHEVTFTRADGPAAPTGKDYELWVIPAGKDPISLGVLREGDLKVALASLPAGTTLAVTLELAGGSPTGAPQGNLLVAAVIEG